MEQTRYTYRAKRRKNTGFWVYGTYMKFLPYTRNPLGKEVDDKDYKHLIILGGSSDWGMKRDLTVVEVLEDSVCQCLGCVDSRGLPLYEEDIVRYNDKLYVIVYNKGTYSFVLSEIGDYTFPVLIELPTNSKELLMVGNTFDNADIIVKALGN